MAQIGLGKMPLMGVWAAGRGHAIRTRYLGLQKPWVDPHLPQKDLRSVKGTSDSQRETNYPLPSWHLARACLDLLPEGKHICGAASVCLALWRPLYICPLPRWRLLAPLYNEEIEAQRGYVTSLGHKHHVAESVCQYRIV